MNSREDLQAERVCEYQISTNRKRLWIVELDLLDMFEEACRKLNISYFMVFGSALGAVRHKGFIPWDDDIDLGMLRKDFNIFVEHGKEYFPDYVDIQYGISNHGPDILMRIRDGRTTGIIRNERHLEGNKGVFIEIYVYDYVGTGVLADLQMKLASLLCGAMYASKKGVKGVIQRGLNKLISPKKLWAMYTKVCTAGNDKHHTHVNLVSLPLYGRRTKLFRIEAKDLSSTVTVPFEYTTARIPVGVDNFLRTSYGDYMTLPPVEKRGTHHDFLVFYDPGRCYKEYDKSDIPDRYFAGDIDLELL